MDHSLCIAGTATAVPLVPITAVFDLMPVQTLSAAHSQVDVLVACQIVSVSQTHPTSMISREIDQ